MSLLSVMAEDSGDVLDSWEEQVDSGILDERLKKISVSKIPSGEERTQPIMMAEDTGRTEFKPQVRILKREANTNSVPGNSPRIAKVNKPVKTLEQREAEYAEARMRIFGAAEAEPEPENDANGSNSVNSENCAESAAEKQFKVNKAESKSANSILRQPRGPDGSVGFHSNR